MFRSRCRVPCVQTPVPDSLCSGPGAGFPVFRSWSWVPCVQVLVPGSLCSGSGVWVLMFRSWCRCHGSRRSVWLFQAPPAWRRCGRVLGSLGSQRGSGDSEGGEGGGDRGVSGPGQSPVAAVAPFSSRVGGSWRPLCRGVRLAPVQRCPACGALCVVVLSAGVGRPSVETRSHGFPPRRAGRRRVYAFLAPTPLALYTIAFPYVVLVTLIIVFNYLYRRCVCVCML